MARVTRRNDGAQMGEGGMGSGHGGACRGYAAILLRRLRHAEEAVERSKLTRQ